MDDHTHTIFLLPERSHQAKVRAALRRMTEQAGFSGHRLGEAEIAIAEITSNLIKHTTSGGQILARKIIGPAAGIELISIDHGPGMNRADQMLKDGISTTGTLGQGLGAIQRICNVFDLYSIPGWGTILYAQIYPDKKFKPAVKGLQISSIAVAKKNETICGDCWAVLFHEKKYRIMMIDGLGHGKEASKAAHLAADVFKKYPRPTPVLQLQEMDEKLKQTRGGVVTVAYLDEHFGQVQYAGVGNITMSVLSQIRSQGCLSYNGIVGHNIPSFLNNHVVQLDPRKDGLLMHSDGLSARWNMLKYPAIFQYHGMILCAALYKDYNRNNDDATILFVKFVK